MKNLNFKTIVKFSFFTFALLILNNACQKDDLSKATPIEEINSSKDGEIIVGEKLENPYSLKNMQRAYESLKSNLGLKSAEILEPTHYYVRFLPNDTSEYNALKADTTLMLFSYPLDCEISEGEFFHDPSLPNEQITWQYTKVPISYVFGNVRYEILEELYIPIETEDAGLKSASAINWYDLLDESMRITGNLDKEIKIQSETGGTQLKGLLPSKWNPSATIKVWDDVMGKSIPLVGAKVRARHLLHWDTEITNNAGYAKLESFRYSVNYSIVWERAHWDIRDGWFIQAYYNGPNSKKGHWDLDITGGKSIKYATIHRAAHRHVYGDNLGMLRPVNPLVSVHKICYIDDKGTGDYWANVGGGILPDIRIYGKDSYTGKDKTTDVIFRTTCHELGHAVQCINMGNIQFWQVSKIIYESWADAVEWALTLKEYEELGVKIPSYIINNMNKQMSWPYANDDNAYSPMFIDLVDDYNQKNVYGNNYPDDKVTGYTMANLSRIALNSYGLSSLKSTLKNRKPQDVTDAQIDLLFKRYEEVWK